MLKGPKSSRQLLDRAHNRIVCLDKVEIALSNLEMPALGQAIAAINEYGDKCNGSYVDYSDDTREEFYEETPISHKKLDLSIRIQNSLDNLDPPILFLGQLLALDPTKLRPLASYLDVKSLMACLEKHGLKFGMTLKKVSQLPRKNTPGIYHYSDRLPTKSGYYWAINKEGNQSIIHIDVLYTDLSNFMMFAGPIGNGVL